MTYNDIFLVRENDFQHSHEMWLRHQNLSFLLWLYTSQLPSEERVCLDCFKNVFIETENEEHFLLRCLHPDLKVLSENLLLKA